MLNESPLDPLPASAGDLPSAGCIDVCVAVAEGAISANTERALRSDLGIFATWCGERGLGRGPGQSGDRRGIRRRDGDGARSRDRAPLRGEHRRRAPGDRGWTRPCGTPRCAWRCSACIGRAAGARGRRTA